MTHRRRAPAAARSCALFLASPLRGLPRVIQFSSDGIYFGFGDQYAQCEQIRRIEAYNQIGFSTQVPASVSIDKASRATFETLLHCAKHDSYNERAIETLLAFLT